MSNILIIYAHPKTPKSFNQDLLQTLTSHLESQNHEIKIRDLYAQHFQSHLTTDDLIALHSNTTPMDIQEEQNYIIWANTIIFIYPIWWASAPAIMKGYFDRILAYGFAYKIENGQTKGLLTDKKAIIINSTGTPYDTYERLGFYRAMQFLTDTGIFEFCGFKKISHLFYGGTPTATQDTIQTYIINAIKITDKFIAEN